MKLYLKEIRDRYIQENFKRLQKIITEINNGTTPTSTTVVTNNIVKRIPLDGTEPISGTIEPDTAGVYNIGSTSKPLSGLYTNEVYVSGSSLYVDGKKAINVDPITNRLTYSNEPDQDLEVKSKGTGTLYIDSEGDIVISSTGNVTVNGSAVANYSFATDIFDVPSQIINSNQIVLSNIPIQNSETISLNGLVLTEGASYDYTIVDNVITFNSGVLTSDGFIRANYAY